MKIWPILARGFACRAGFRDSDWRCGLRVVLVMEGSYHNKAGGGLQRTGCARGHAQNKAGWQNEAKQDKADAQSEAKWQNKASWQNKAKEIQHLQ